MVDTLSDAFRPIELVEAKVREARFFARKMNESGPDIFATNCYFNAFCTSSRAVTFTLQKVMAGAEGFGEWYEAERLSTLSGEEAQFMKAARNAIEKEGKSLLIGGTAFRHSESETTDVAYYVADSSNRNGSETYDMKTLCDRHLMVLEDLVKRCKVRFGLSSSDRENSIKKAITEGRLTIEDLEEMCGFPRGWTGAIPEQERLRLLIAEVLK